MPLAYRSPDRRASLRPPRLIALALAALALSACSRAADQIPWRDEMRAWFNNGSLRPGDPSPSYWTRSAEELFLRRIGFADVTVVGKITRSTLFSQLDSPRALGLSFAPVEVLHGDIRPFLDEAGEIPLHLAAAADDFRPALHALRDIRDTRFLLLLKRVPPPPESAARGSGWRASLQLPRSGPRALPSFRWALYYADPALVGHVRHLFQLYRKRAGR